MLSKTNGQSLPYCRRIRQRTEFEQAFRANRVNNKWFVVYARKNANGFARLGLVVSKKIIPKATARNFAKRLVREVFRCNFSVTTALDVVVRAKLQINPENSAEGRQALDQLLQALRI